MKTREMDNLSKDVLQARALGYSSYGRYKADHPRTKEMPLDVPGKPGKVCPGCQKVFCPSSKGVIYCSHACGARYRSLAKQRKEMMTETGGD